MVDILFLAHNRPEFTEASLRALFGNTPNQFVHIVADDCDRKTLNVMFKIKTQYPGYSDLMQIPHAVRLGPVAVLNRFVDDTANGYSEFLGATPEAKASEFIVKIDNDTIVPPGWLPACLDVMWRYPEVDLLGIEPWSPETKLFPRWVEPSHDCLYRAEAARGGMEGMLPTGQHRARKVSHIGGIGVFRRSAFERFGRPNPNTQDGRFGFTEWQWANPSMVKAFLDPPLPVVLLDHLPVEPWRSISRAYEQAGIQRRQWGEYGIEHKALWEWWLDSLPPASSEGRGVDVGGPR